MLVFWSDIGANQQKTTMEPIKARGWGRDGVPEVIVGHKHSQLGHGAPLKHLACEPDQQLKHTTHQYSWALLPPRNGHITIRLLGNGTAAWRGIAAACYLTLTCLHPRAILNLGNLAPGHAGKGRGPHSHPLLAASRTTAIFTTYEYVRGRSPILGSFAGIASPYTSYASGSSHPYIIITPLSMQDPRDLPISMCSNVQLTPTPSRQIGLIFRQQHEIRLWISSTTRERLGQQQQDCGILSI